MREESLPFFARGRQRGCRDPGGQPVRYDSADIVTHEGEALGCHRADRRMLGWRCRQRLKLFDLSDLLEHSVQRRTRRHAHPAASRSPDQTAAVVRDSAEWQSRFELARRAMRHLDRRLACFGIDHDGDSQEVRFDIQFVTALEDFAVPHIRTWPVRGASNVYYATALVGD